MQRLTDALPASLSITVKSHIPSSIGLASSAAVFSCFAVAIAGLIKERRELTPKEISVIARLGSGSAARSIFGGFAVVCAGEGDAIDSAYGEQVSDERHWPLHDIVIVFSTQEKKVGSSEGHELAHTSPHFEARIGAIRTHRQRDCIDAILARDFEKLQHVSEEDCMDMHKVMQTSTPALHYLTADTYRVVKEVERWRKEQHIPVLYTMDAGPTVHLFCPLEAVEGVRGFARTQKDCTVFETMAGPGASII